MLLSGMDQPVRRQDRINDAGETCQPAPVNPSRPAMFGRVGKHKDLVRRVAVDSEIPGRRPPAYAVCQNGPAYLHIEFHALHPPPPIVQQGAIRTGPFSNPAIPPVRPPIRGPFCYRCSRVVTKNRQIGLHRNVMIAQDFLARAVSGSELLHRHQRHGDPLQGSRPCEGQ